MASIRKKDRSPYWFACFLLPDGRRTQRSTKVTDRREAMKLAVQYEDAARRRVTETQARRILSDIHEQLHGSPLSTPTVAEYVDRWLEAKKKETAPATYSVYRGAAVEFRDFLGDHASAPIHFVTRAQVADWRDAVAKRATPRTANGKLKILRVLFTSAWRDGHLSENVAAKVPGLKAEKGKRRAFTETELRKLLRIASPEWRGMILFGLYTGQRLRDIARLTWGNVDVEDDEIHLTTGKTGRVQQIPIAAPIKAYLASLPAGDDPDAPLFPKAHKVATKGLDVSPLSQGFHELLAAAQLVEPRTAKERGEGPKRKSGTGKGRDAPRANTGLSFHSLRHTAVTMLKRTGSSQAVAMDLVGHESAAISANYTHVDAASKRAALANLPDITAEP